MPRIYVSKHWIVRSRKKRDGRIDYIIERPYATGAVATFPTKERALEAVRVSQKHGGGFGEVVRKELRTAGVMWRPGVI